MISTPWLSSAAGDVSRLATTCRPAQGLARTALCRRLGDVTFGIAPSGSVSARPAVLPISLMPSVVVVAAVLANASSVRRACR
jgi:hypothetical protein